MKEYSPKRRTAVVFAGSGTSGAYHAGVLRALDESGIKLDLAVGSGVGTVAAAFAAVAGGAKLHGPGGFWDDISWDAISRLRPGLRVAVLLLAMSFGVFLLPLVVAVIFGLLFPLFLVVDMAVPGASERLAALMATLPALGRTAYLAALSVPMFVLSILALVSVAATWVRRRRRAVEAFESPFDNRAGRERLGRLLWEVARGSTLSALPPSDADLGRRYVALAADNLGQPGFRELILRAADLETGGALPFVLLADGARAAFASARGRGPRSRVEGLTGAVDLRAPGYDVLFFDVVASGLPAPLPVPLVRVSFPKGGLHAGETHRLAEATLAGGCGLADALAAGAEQVILVSAVPETPSTPPRRRGVRAAADAMMATLERQGLAAEVSEAERMNRLVETLGHRTEDGGRAWQDPVTGRVFRDVSLYVIRPERRSLGPLELDGAQDPATEVLETADDLGEAGYRDAYRLFVEPVVGAAPEAPRKPVVEDEEGQPVEL
jgi:hypothetical protein